MGAVVGAGFASGQEIAVFFSRFGRWSWAAILSASLLAWLLTRRIFTLGEAVFRRPIWRVAFGMLAAVTGGAMTAAAGDIAALTLPIPGARAIGFVLTLGAGWLCATRNTPLLRRVCQGMILLLVGMMILCLRLPAQRAAVLPGLRGFAAGAASAAYGACYAGFNLALSAPMLVRRGDSRSPGERRVTAAAFAALLGGLLALGNAVLLRQPLAMHGTLPMVYLSAQLGKPGFVLCCAALWLAEVSTLAAGLRTLHNLLPRQARWVGAAAILLIAAAGFGAVVGKLYPLLGALCTVFMLLPKDGTLHPGRNVV